MRRGIPWIILVVFASTIAPRLAALGDFPYLDDGYHAFLAQYIHHSLATGAGFPHDLSGFRLFPVLFSWVWGMPGNALFWLRLADLCAAALAAWFLCGLLINESENEAFGLLLAFVTLAGLNLPGAIQSGFKNYFFPAFACFFAALNITRGANPRSWRWVWAGALSALGVLFRETFFPFVLLALAALIVIRNFAALLRFIAGGAICALLVTLSSMLLRGQYMEMFDFYFSYGAIYGPEAGRRWLKFVENSGRALLLFLPLIGLFVGALAMLIFKGRNQFRGRSFFWLGAAALPLAEPLLKIGFIYHFSVCLPGLAGFCAFTFRCLDCNALMRKTGIGLTALACCAMGPQLALHFTKAPLTWEVALNYPAQGWPEELRQKSCTLAAAAKIHELLPRGGTAATTGFTYFIFPASQTLPPELSLGDLSRTYIRARQNSEEFLARLGANPPDLVLIAHADQDHSAIFERELLTIFKGLDNYEEIAALPIDESKNYGWLGYTLFRKK